MRQILAPDGSVTATMPDLADKQLVEMYDLMVRSRDFDRRALGCAASGAHRDIPDARGAEAMQVGSAYALAAEDFIYPGYREHGAQIARGMPLDVILSYWRGLPTTEWDVHRYRMMTVTVPIASQLPHAVGHAYSARMRGEDLVNATYFGDGATSENDFHSGLTFAGVWRTPTVFLCANNLYAISGPV